jgi:hypothetical protein
VDLAAGDLQAALVAFRRGARLWQQIGSPYEAARTQV